MTEELYLKIPTAEDERGVMDARKEFLEIEDRIPGAGSLEKYENFEMWLTKITSDLSEQTVTPGRVPSTQYLTIRKSDNKIVGFVQIRHHINLPILEKYGGHIGDAVVPSERNKGYATKQIALALNECKKLGLSKVLITCKDWNTASERTIIKNGGIFEKALTDENGATFKRFWITIQ